MQQKRPMQRMAAQNGCHSDETTSQTLKQRLAECLRRGNISAYFSASGFVTSPVHCNICRYNISDTSRRLIGASR